MLNSKSIVFSLLIALFSGSALAVSSGDKAPDFSAPALIGDKQIKLSDYKGKVVYLDFWASWCPPCRVSLPLLDKLRGELKGKGFEVVAVNLDADSEDGRAFLKKINVKYPVAMNPEGTIPDSYGLKGMPTAYLLDKNGHVAVVHEGFKASDVASIKSEILRLLAK